MQSQQIPKIVLNLNLKTKEMKLKPSIKLKTMCHTAQIYGKVLLRLPS